MKTSSTLPLLANFIEPPIGLVSVLAIDAPKIIVVVDVGHVYTSTKVVPILPLVYDLKVFALLYPHYLSTINIKKFTYLS